VVVVPEFKPFENSTFSTESVECSLRTSRRLNQGTFHWPGIRHGLEVELDNEQLQALVLGCLAVG
jgi:hypothetical protein